MKRKRDGASSDGDEEYRVSQKKLRSYKTSYPPVKGKGKGRAVRQDDDDDDDEDVEVDEELEGVGGDTDSNRDSGDENRDDEEDF
jgi:hypothetical protein